MADGSALLFQGVPQPIRLQGAAEVLHPFMAELHTFFALWPFREVTPQTGPGITLHCTWDADGCPLFRVDAPWLPVPFEDTSPTCALCNLSIELVSAECRAGTDLLCLHAAAVRLDGVCVLLLGTNNVGKSSLVACLLADGHVAYGDDLLGLGHDGEIHAFGIAPRLRLPLPPSARVAAFAQGHAGSHDAHYLYLDPARIPLAPHGTTAVPQAVVLLQRRAGASPRLLELTSQTALLRLLPRFIMLGGDAIPLLERATALAQRVPVFVLRYGSLDTGAACLAKELARSLADRPCQARIPKWVIPDSRESGAEAGTTGDVKRPGCPKRVSPAGACLGGRRLRLRRGRRAPALVLYRQRPGVRLIRQGKQGFLTSVAGHGLYRLNTLGQAIWALLESPLSRREAASLLLEAFPAEPPSRIHNDIARLFQDLHRAGLIRTFFD